jgi:Sec-independent protein secretion pathway component TatC
MQPKLNLIQIITAWVMLVMFVTVHQEVLRAWQPQIHQPRYKVVFLLKLFFAFGIAFEIPVAIMLLCWSGATTTKSLKEKRPYIVVGVFVVAMLLTPPDVLSQTLLALPMLLLFELGLILAAFYTAKPQQESEE